MHPSRNPQPTSAPASDPCLPLPPKAALDLAYVAARRALHRTSASDADAARDVAADALAVLLRRAIPLRRPSILAAVKHVARKLAAQRRRWRWLGREELRAELDADMHPLAPAPDSADAPERPGARPLTRTFRDGSTARLDGEPCEADIDALILVAPDGSVFRGRAALRRAQALLVAERCRAGSPLHTHNARRAAAALDRDAQLLAVSGLPWHEALDRLAALGIVVTRDGLRSGQRAARLRCEGRSAHDAARR